MDKLEPSSNRFSIMGSVSNLFDRVCQRAGEVAAVVFNAINQTLEAEKHFEDPEIRVEDICRDRKARDRQCWKAIVGHINYPFMNLSTRPSLKVILMGEKKPHLFVKLPRRQLALFPDSMKVKLLNTEEDRLDIFFAIYFQEEGAKEFTLSIPELKEKGDDRVYVGFYGGSGVTRGSGETVPWHFIRKYTKSQARALKVGLTGDVGAFKIGAYSDNCRGPDYGVAVYGLVLTNSGRGFTIRKFLEHSESLQEFTTKVGSELTEIFKFNEDY